MIIIRMMSVACCVTGVDHMRDLLADLDAELPESERLAAGDGDWNEILDGFAACVDWPTARHANSPSGTRRRRYCPACAPRKVGAKHARRGVAMYHGGSVLHRGNRARAQADSTGGDPWTSRFTRLGTRPPGAAGRHLRRRQLRCDHGTLEQPGTDGDPARAAARVGIQPTAGRHSANSSRCPCPIGRCCMRMTRRLSSVADSLRSTPGGEGVNPAGGLHGLPATA